MLLDPTLEVVFALLLSNSVLCLDSVWLIIEVACATQRVNQRSPERIIKLVLLGRVSYPSTVRECDNFATFDI